MRWPSSRFFAIAVLTALTLGSASAITEEEAESDRGYEVEKRGLNPYTAPSIAQIFQRLDELKPLPFEQLQRNFTAGGHGSRAQLGMIFGGMIADGFLIVECERKNLVDELGRALIRQARSLGVEQRVMRHSASLTELGRRGDWPAMRRELTATQNDVEHAMIVLHDRRLAHLTSLGGWLRGLEICSAAVSENYTRERAKALLQPDLLDYLAQNSGACLRMSLTPPSSRKSREVSRRLA